MVQHCILPLHDVMVELQVLEDTLEFVPGGVRTVVADAVEVMSYPAVDRVLYDTTTGASRNIVTDHVLSCYDKYIDREEENYRVALDDYLDTTNKLEYLSCSIQDMVGAVLESIYPVAISMPRMAVVGWRGKDVVVRIGG